MRRALIIGYGNPYRRDDGVALVVVNQLRALLGQGPLEEDTDGLDGLGHDVDTVFLQQLTPELAEIIAGYQEVIFVDAHLGHYAELLREVVLRPTTHHVALVSHHLHPEALLALAESFFGLTPHARLVSVRGHDFDFGTELSDRTKEGSELATARIWDLVHGQGM